MTTSDMFKLKLTLVIYCLILTVNSRSTENEFLSFEQDFDEEELLLQEDGSQISLEQTQIELERMARHSVNPQLSELLMNNLHTPYMITTDMYRWVKSTKSGWSSILSAQPLEKGKISEITVLVVNNRHFLIGCSERNDDVLHNHYIGQWRNSASYNAASGARHNYRGNAHAVQGCNLGDEMTIRVDLTEGRGTVQFLKNGRSLGLAYAGLFDWDNVHFGMSLNHVGSIGRIVDYKVYRK